MPTPAHQPTERDRETVRTMYAYGICEEDIARVIGITDRTLRKYYREELDTARPHFHRLIAQRIALFALGKIDGAPHADSLRACMFIAKTQMKWRETDNLELQGKGGGAIVIRIDKDDAG
jgi:hypothetical protein